MLPRSLSVFLLLALPPARASAAALLLEHVARPLDAEATMAALEPWETPVEGFFIRSHFDLPLVDLGAWRLVIDGDVQHPLTLSLADLQALPQKSLHAVLECSGNGRGLQQPTVGGVQWERGAVGNGGWTGVALGDLLAEAGVKDGAQFLTVRGADQPALPSVPAFIRSIPLAKALEPTTIVALKMNGEPLPLLHGGPLRLILPNWYGENWLKWVTHITVTRTEDQSFYMKKAYRMPRHPVKPGEHWDAATGVPLTQLLVQSLVVNPVAAEVVEIGKVPVRGKAFSGAGAITKVELSADGGKSWAPATVEPQHADGGWQAFQGTVTAAAAGPLQIASRATDAAGNVQPLEHTWNPSGYARNAVDRVAVAAAAFVAPSGAAVLETRCTTCHSREMIESQRLTPAQWRTEVDKMVATYGAKLPPSEIDALLAYVSKRSPDLPPKRPQPLTYGWAAGGLGDEEPLPPGDPAHGATLFNAQCAACHGKAGDGFIGPRLAGRAISGRDFRFAVLYGKYTMPAFGGTLKIQDVADLHTFLRE